MPAAVQTLFLKVTTMPETLYLMSAAVEDEAALMDRLFKAASDVVDAYDVVPYVDGIDPLLNSLVGAVDAILEVHENGGFWTPQSQAG